MLVIPCPTRWNSLFDALKLVVQILDTKGAALDSLFQLVGLSTLTDGEKAALRDYVAIMGPLAQALDLLQGEKTAYLGCLLPYLSVTISYTKMLAHAHPGGATLAQAITHEILSRFSKDFENEKTRLAAAFHPQFKMDWLRHMGQSSSQDEKKTLKHLMIQSLSDFYDARTEATLSSDSGDSDSPGCTFNVAHAFTSKRSVGGKRNSAARDVERYLEKPTEGVDWKNGFESSLMKDFFIRLNTPIPSSAAVERLFSIAKDVLRPKRTSMSDRNFEKAMFLRANKSVLSLSL